MIPFAVFLPDFEMASRPSSPILVVRLFLCNKLLRYTRFFAVQSLNRRNRRFSFSSSLSTLDKRSPLFFVPLRWCSILGFRVCEPMKIVTVTGFKGGCGKSVTAIHLATFFSALGDVVLVDGDPNRTAIAWSERGNLPFVVVDERKAMKVVQGRDYLVIDTPARPDSTDLKELAEGADLLILPTLPDVVSLEPMLQTAQALGGATYRALLTVVPPKPSREGEIMREELRANGIPVFRTLIRRSAGFQKAALAGVPISALSGRDRLGWLDYEALGKEVLEVLND